MLSTIKRELSARGIDTVGVLPLSECRIMRPYLLEKHGFSDSGGLFAVVFAIPYYTHCEEKNISSYAVSRDYHLFCRELFDDILPILRSARPDCRFEGFADHSPIDEIHAAALAGLGLLGQNGLLITPKYSSYVFLAEIITDAPMEVYGKRHIETCEGCGRCLELCPMKKHGVCLSALTQKKGELSENEQKLIMEYGSAWGCDICQQVCPHTERVLADETVYTDIEFFKSLRIPMLTTDILDDMNECDFNQRAYSWRGKDTVKRNLCILEKNKEK